ncbi:IclR family transcriptional regulator C-terminal domain-containing protein [Pseudoxanthomonas sp. JBR18]|uniref:IclR family transcriptional regulator domain-containing protein n=1 Tax=Pseudoxanthomonas sp. JBR18 TaxID=2969308 RepID=UPI002305239C|nr:IclR family transcriptional regulator C-terminal domain-containing protein [Pseudoxanthomonas sp. JBR18]WCE04329.1 IclR family transcriptional regulator C-terminal domain-containing protein [Pseudoxanthomonas sp. JBR18]
MSDHPRKATGTIERALDVLEAIGTSPKGVTFAEIAQQVQLPRTTAYRMLSGLIERNLVRRESSRRAYRLGFGALQLSRESHPAPQLVVAANIELNYLRAITGETTCLWVRDGVEVIALERTPGAHRSQGDTHVGQGRLLHVTAAGKALLAAMRNGERNPLLARLDMTPFTPNSATSRDQVAAMIAKVKDAGYAIDDEESRLGARCVATVVRDMQGQVRGALSLSGATARFTPERMAQFGTELMEAAQRIGERLAGTVEVTYDDQVQRVAGAPARGADFVTWSASRGCWYWVDVHSGTLHRADAGGDRILASLPVQARGLNATPSGLEVIHGEGMLRLDFEGALAQRQLESRGHAAPIAACVQPDGREWQVTPDPAGGYRIATWLHIGIAVPGWRIDDRIDALCWNPDGTRLFAASATSGTLYEMRPGDARIRRLAVIPKASGEVRGLAADAHGDVWVALYGGWAVARFSAEGGMMQEVVGLPMAWPTSLAVGGDRQLAITAAAGPDPDAPEEATGLYLLARPAP